MPLEGLTARGLTYNDEYWGNWLKAMYTLFQVWTLESWSEVISRPLIFSGSWYVALAAGIYFPLFNFLNSVFLLNVLVSVFVDVYLVQSATEREEKEEQEYEAKLQAASSDGPGAVAPAATTAETDTTAAPAGTAAAEPVTTAPAATMPPQHRCPSLLLVGAHIRPPRRRNSLGITRLGSMPEVGVDTLLHARISNLASSMDERVRAVEGQMASVVAALDRLHAALRESDETPGRPFQHVNPATLAINPLHPLAQHA